MTRRLSRKTLDTLAKRRLRHPVVVVLDRVLEAQLLGRNQNHVAAALAHRVPSFVVPRDAQPHHAKHGARRRLRRRRMLGVGERSQFRLRRSARRHRAQPPAAAHRDTRGANYELYEQPIVSTKKIARISKVENSSAPHFDVVWQIGREIGQIDVDFLLLVDFHRETRAVDLLLKQFEAAARIFCLIERTIGPNTPSTCRTWKQLISAAS